MVLIVPLSTSDWRSRHLQFNSNIFYRLPERFKMKVAASPEIAALTTAKPTQAAPAAVNGPNDEIPL